MDRTQCELRLSCAVLHGGHGRFLIRIFDETEREVLSCCMEDGRWTAIPLRAGFYTVRAQAYNRLNPGAITKWLRLCPASCCGVQFLFSRPLREFETADVSLRLTDAQYPGITEISGGLTVWRHKTTPSAS